MNFYGKSVREVLLTGHATLEELMQECNLPPRYIFDGILNLRSDGIVVRAIPGKRTGMDVEPTTYALEDRHD